MELSRMSLSISLLALLLLLGGCGLTPETNGQLDPAELVRTTTVPASGGSIYQANTSMRLFGDLKAARVGDILTVRLLEQTNATKSAATTTSKKTAVSVGGPVIFGRPITDDGIPIFSGSLDGDNSFAGSGASNQSNSLVGNITVTVVERYPSGNLRIQGEKWVTINQGREFIRLTGMIRPYDISPDNTVLSEKIANAQITYSSKGALAAANRMGLFARFFQSFLSGF